MKTFNLIIAVLFFSALSQTAFSQNTDKAEPQKQPIVCSDCGFPIKGNPIYLPKPKYPLAASAVNASGTVGVSIKIDEQGNVIEANAVSGHPLLRAAAIKAALEAKFKPVILSGKAVQVIGFISYNFAPKASVQIEVSEQKERLKADEDKKLKLPIVNGGAKYLPKPEYPQEAKDFCASGKVEVEVLINEEGNVIEAEAVLGDELLLDSAVEAVKKAKFSPTSEIPVKIRGIVVYNFIPEKKCIIVDKIVNERALSIPKPQTSKLNRSERLQIKAEPIVTVQIVVDESGKVIYAKAISGHPMLRAACEISARQAKFSPSFINGPSIKVKALLAYKFKPDGTITDDFPKL